MLFSKSSPSECLRHGNQLGFCRGCSVVGLGRSSGVAAELLPELCLPNPGEMCPVAESWAGCRGSQGMFPLGLGRYLYLQPRPRHSWALTKNTIPNQTRKETAKRCHCTTLRLLGVVPMGCQLFQHPLCNPSAHDMKGEDDWERAGTRQLLELGKGQPSGEAAPGWCRALAVTPGIESQPCAGPGSIPGSRMSQSQPCLAAKQGDPAEMGICSLIPARTSQGSSVLRDIPGAPHSRWLLEELQPGLCWVCLGSSSSQLLTGAGLGTCGGCCWCNQELPV